MTSDESDMRDGSFESTPSTGDATVTTGSPRRALILATLSFALSFARGA